MAEERGKQDQSPNGAPEGKLSSIALFSDVDVASICESAIQSVCVGVGGTVLSYSGVMLREEI